MKAIYIYNRGRKTYIGKHIGDTIFREFAHRRAILWQDNSLSFDAKLLKYAKSKNVKKFVFTDTVKRKSSEIGILSLINNGQKGEHGEGEQWYFPADLPKKIKYKKTPYVKTEVILTEDSFTLPVDKNFYEGINHEDALEMGDPQDWIE